MGFQGFWIVFILNMSILFSAQASIGLTKFKQGRIQLEENQYFHLQTITVNASVPTETVSVWCEAGDRVATGGCGVEQDFRDVIKDGIANLEEGPAISGWSCTVGPSPSGTESSIVTAFVICETAR